VLIAGIQELSDFFMGRMNWIPARSTRE
jgi:hypothetical protein